MTIPPDTINSSFEGRIFLQDAGNVAVASLGQIVEGYAVVFGNEHQINLRSLKLIERRDFLDFVLKVRQHIELHFGSTIMFEHGACSPGTRVSCGVDRMHVHVVPFDGSSLIESIEKKYRCLAITATVEQMLEKMSDWQNDRPYFWIDEGSHVFLFSYGEKRESQVVRRAIAEQAGMGSRWNWREFPTQDAAERLTKKLLTHVAISRQWQTA
jgi:hypothetical protein